MTLSVEGDFLFFIEVSVKGERMVKNYSFYDILSEKRKYDKNIALPL
jgi:hypothetical protein